MAQSTNKGMDSAFIELAQEQLDGVNARLVEVEEEIASLQEERATLVGQRAHLRGLVNPTAKADGTKDGQIDVQLTRDAVVDLIRANGRPMHFRNDIYPRLARAGHEIEGKDPARTMLSRIFNDARLHRTARGEYGLAEWRGKGPSSASKPTASPQRRPKPVDAAEEVLRAAGAPLHYREIAKRTLKGGIWETSAKEPAHAMARALNKDMEENGDKSSFIKIRPGIFGLRGRDEAAG